VGLFSFTGPDPKTFGEKIVRVCTNTCRLRRYDEFMTKLCRNTCRPCQFI
jgi:hypothetical protein